MTSGKWSEIGSGAAKEIDMQSENQISNEQRRKKLWVVKIV